MNNKTDNRVDTSMVQYVNDRKGNRRGVVIAQVVDDEVRMGWAYVNKKAGDKYDKDRAFTIALGRVAVHTNKQVPRDVLKVANSLSIRAMKYFRTDKVILSGVTSF